MDNSSYVPQYLRGLNLEQREAALATEGPVLVLAGAGSGKTRTLVYRIVHLLRKGVEAKKILAVTFTNRAAGEMRERVAATAGKEARGLTVSTFHSLGARILRAHGEKIGLPPRFSIYGPPDQLAIIKRIVAEEVHIVATAGDETYDLKRVLSTISDWKNRLVTPTEAVQEVAMGITRENRSDDYAVLAADVYPRYEESLRAAGAVDFDDLLILPVHLLRDHMDAREQLWRRWQYLMIDEYQDTNGAQLEMARLVTGPQRNLCVVGDDDQSIYAWRGADLRNILEFERHFPGARVIILEQNYRSTQRILDAANSVIANNSARKPKRMRTDNGPGPKIDYWEFDQTPQRTAEELEAEMVAREIGVRRFQEQLDWADFAILYRANYQSRVIEEALRTVNVPYRVIGGTSYFDRKEVADAVAYLRAVANPLDEVSLRRIINYPTRSIGRTTQLRLIEAARAAGVPLSGILDRAGTVDGLNRAQAEAVERLGAMLAAARIELGRIESALAADGTGAGSLERWAASLIRDVGLEGAIRAENKSEKVADIRIDNLRDFIASIGTYEQRVWADVPLPDEEADWAPPTIAGFIERVSLITDEPDDRDDDEGPGRVTLMTLHSAKGLEFSHVFLIGLEEEILPHARAVQEITAGVASDPIAEERRLFYVGLTRARHRITLSGCRVRRRGPDALQRQPSRFLKEIPSELIESRSAGAESSLSDEDRKEMRENFFSKMKEMLAE